MGLTRGFDAVVCGFDTRYNPRMASVPERHEVLSRLGIVKGGNDDLFAPVMDARPELRRASIDGALESFPAEWGATSVIERALKAIASRNALLLVIAVTAVCAVTILFAFRGSAASTTPSPVDSEVASAAASAEAPGTTSNGASPTRRPLIASGVKAPAVKARPFPIARQPTTPNPAASVSPEPAKSQDQRLDTRTPISSEVTAPALPPSTDEIASVIDETLYSKDDEDVRPPKLLSGDLPVPTINGWLTRTNVIEVIVSETGAVERARFVATPQRMPDTFILSRAKVWTFTPAMKNGQPVRYRLLLSWEVNP